MEFIDDAIFPSLIMQPRSGRQDRPLFILLAALPTHLLIKGRFWRLMPAGVYRAFATAPALRVHYDKHRPPISWQVYPRYILCGYIAYLMINGLVLVLSLLLFHWLVIERFEWNTLVYAFALMILTADVVKTFFWTPHTQMFNLIVLFGCILMCEELLRRSLRNVSSYLLLGFAIGLLSLAYGSFAMWMIAALLVLSFGALRGKPRLTLGTAFQQGCALLAGFAAPTLGWITICKSTVGSYSNAEIDGYHEFIWIVDSARAGSHQLSRDLAANWMAFLHSLAPVSIFPLVLLSGVIVLASMLHVPLRPLLRDRWATFAAIAITISSSFLFFFLAGFYQERLSVNVVLPLILTAGIVALDVVGKARWRSFPLPSAIVIVAWLVLISRVALEVVKSGPYE